MVGRSLLVVGALIALLWGGGCTPFPVTLEERAQAIDRRLICPVCPGETIDQSRAQQAQEMRAVVREMLAQGKTEEEILQFFVERFGPGVLAAPPAQGGHWLAWLVPPAVVVVASAALWWATRRMVSPPPASPAPLGEDLTPYLEEVDRALQERLARRRREGENHGG